jgi:hypothetical protein
MKRLTRIRKDINAVAFPLFSRLQLSRCCHLCRYGEVHLSCVDGRQLCLTPLPDVNASFEKRRDEKQQRDVEEGLSTDELALFDLFKKDSLGKVERKRDKQASRHLLGSIKDRRTKLDHFWEKEQTIAEPESLCPFEFHAGSPLPGGRVDLNAWSRDTTTLVPL